MSHNIPHSKPTINARDARIVYNVVQSGRLAQGRGVAAFEKKFARFQKIKYSAATSSGTSALHLCLLALGVKKGDNVIIPSFVCTALMNAVAYVGADVRVIDIEEGDFNISVREAKKKINKKTKAVIVPHMFGMAADLKSLLDLNVPLIEDCAQSIGATYRKKPVGGFGALSIYSFYATKMMTTGEGGMVTSNNKGLIERIKDLRDYDQKQDYKTRFNYKMTDIQAALGISQVSRLRQWIKRRRDIAQRYHQVLKDCALTLPVEPPGRKHVYFRYVVKVKKNQKKFLRQLQSKGIHCAAPVYKPLHQYLHLKGYPCTDQMMKEAVSLPIYPSLSNAEVEYITKNIKSII